MGKMRTEDFKIGCFHGKLVPEDSSIEATLRNELFLIGMLKMEITRAESKDIRLVAYEMPLETGQSRGRCIDLLGYDRNKKPWIIELKKKRSSDSIDQIIKQINDYEDMFQEIRDYVEDEIRKRNHWNEFKFSEGTGKIILAGREFFKNIRLGSCKSLGIYCCSFSRIQDEMKEEKVALLENNKGKGFVSLTIHNK